MTSIIENSCQLQEIFLLECGHTNFFVTFVESLLKQTASDVISLKKNHAYNDVASTAVVTQSPILYVFSGSPLTKRLFKTAVFNLWRCRI